MTAPPVLAAVLAAAAAGLVVPPGPGRGVRRLGALVIAPGRHGRPTARSRRHVPRSRRVRRSQQVPPVPGPVLLDLVAAVLAAGAPVGTALRVVGAAAADHGDLGAGERLGRLADRHDLGLLAADDPAPPWVRALVEALLLAREAGVAAAPLLTAAAASDRRRQAGEARMAAARLGVRVVLPTGLCLLPAFVLLAVVPLVLALLGVA